jgi:hypothetical protein
MNRAQLNSRLYIAAESKVGVTGHGVDKAEATRIIRDNAIEAVTERTQPQSHRDYKRCSDEELALALRYLNNNELPVHRYPITMMCTQAQRKKLHSLALECALHYAEYTDCEVVDQRTGEILSSDAVKQRALELFKQRALVGAISKHLYNSWINPKCHSFLKEGGFRYQTRMPTATYYLDYHQLTHMEAMYLIKRFTKIFNEIATRYDTSKYDYSHN